MRLDSPDLASSSVRASSGFQLGPGVGDTMAELIATGAASTPIEPYHIGRFAKPATLERYSA
jgi:hypothetical protein